MPARTTTTFATLMTASELSRQRYHRVAAACAAACFADDDVRADACLAMNRADLAVMAADPAGLDDVIAKTAVARRYLDISEEEWAEWDGSEELLNDLVLVKRILRDLVAMPWDDSAKVRTVIAALLEAGAGGGDE